MLLPLVSSLFLIVALFFSKKKVWLSSKNSSNISLSESFLCWFTSNDLNKNVSNKWIFIYSNLTNALLGIVFITILVCCSLLILSLA